MHFPLYRKPAKPRVFSTPALLKQSFLTPEIRLINALPPRILMTPQAYQDTIDIAAAAKNFGEVGFYGHVTTISKNVYLIDDLYLLPQEASPMDTIMDKDGQGDLFTELLLTKGDEYTQNIKFWGHFHISGTTPSPQDNKQMQEFAFNNWFIRGIFSRTGGACFSFYDYEKGIEFYNVPWSVQIEAPSRLERWKAEVAEKVTDSAVTDAYNQEQYNSAKYADLEAYQDFLLSGFGDSGNGVEL